MAGALPACLRKCPACPSCEPGLSFQVRTARNAPRRPLWRFTQVHSAVVSQRCPLFQQPQRQWLVFFIRNVKSLLTNPRPPPQSSAFMPKSGPTRGRERPVSCLVGAHTHTHARPWPSILGRRRGTGMSRPFTHSLTCWHRRRRVLLPSLPQCRALRLIQNPVGKPQRKMHWQ